MVWKEKFIKDELMKVEVRFNKREKEKRKKMKTLAKGRKKRKRIRKPPSSQKVDVGSQSSHDSNYAEPVDDFFEDDSHEYSGDDYHSLDDSSDDSSSLDDYVDSE